MLLQCFCTYVDSILIIDLHLMVSYVDYRSTSKPEGTNKCPSFLLKSKAEKFRTILYNEADDSRPSQPWKDNSYASNQSRFCI